MDMIENSSEDAMNVYTYSEARRNLASVLEEAERDGEVHITRRDGRTFSLRPEKGISDSQRGSALGVRPTPTGSPFDDVDPVSGTGTTLDDINGWVRRGRERDPRSPSADGPADRSP